MLSGMPSRRLAESPHLWISIAVAAGAATAVAIAARPEAPPPPPPLPEPEIICVLPAAPPPCPSARPGELTTESGVRVVTMRDGCGTESAASGGTVEVRFRGWNAAREQIAAESTMTFPLTSVIPGFADAVRTMRVGDTVRAWIPGPLAYDARLNDPKLRGTLEFEIELLAIPHPR
jgi:hypothetical protein